MNVTQLCLIASLVPLFPSKMPVERGLILCQLEETLTHIMIVGQRMGYDLLFSPVISVIRSLFEGCERVISGSFCQRFDCFCPKGPFEKGFFGGAWQCFFEKNSTPLVISGVIAKSR